MDAPNSAQCFLRLARWGLGLASDGRSGLLTCEAACSPLTLKNVRSCLGEASWQRFKARCHMVADAIGRAEARLLAESGGTFDAME